MKLKFMNIEDYKISKIELAINQWNESFLSIANKFNVGIDIVIRQARLHIPNLDTKSLSSKTIPEKLVKSLNACLYNFEKKYSYYNKKSGSYLLETESIIKDDMILMNDKSFEIEFKEVDAGKGKFIEENLHYLRAFRNNSCMRYGMYIKGFEFPICYLSFTKITRYYRLYCVKNCIDENVKNDEIINLARVYGCNNLPKNSISKTISIASKLIKSKNIKYITTSLNPLLGFNGASFLSSDFKPIGSCPVSYNYKNDKYITRRKSGNIKIDIQKLETPPNLLLVKGLQRKTRRLIKKSNKFIKIDNELYQNDILNLDISLKRKSISSIRNDLEKVWDKITRYHLTDFDNSSDPISKGQCGVTTAFLATELEEDGLDILFCEGDVFFPDPFDPIISHCWIKVKSYYINGIEYKNLIIDLTSDQSGFNEPVICSPENVLLAKGIKYNSKIERKPKTLNNKSLNNRLVILTTKLNNLNKNE